jgi:membrane protease YdiL (CAAX protease family)
VQLIKQPLLAFPLVYLGWAYIFWIPVLLSDSSVWAFPNLIWFLIGGASPVVAGLGLAAANGGKEQLGDLWRRLTDWRRIPGRWWLIILLFWLAYDLAMAGLAVLLGVAGEPLDTNWQLFVNPGPLLFLLVLSFVFPAVEEVGLRGYYLEALQQRFSPLMAGLVNGCGLGALARTLRFFPWVLRQHHVSPRALLVDADDYLPYIVDCARL